MHAVPDPELLRKFRRSSWEVQTSFATPLRRLPAFVHAVVTAARAESATLVIDRFVMGTPNLEALCSRHGLGEAGPLPGVIESTGADEVEELLTAALGDWVDFLWLPSPKPFVLYADHHDCTTFFAHRKHGLTAVVEALSRDFEPLPWLLRDPRHP